MLYITLMFRPYGMKHIIRSQHINVEIAKVAFPLFTLLELISGTLLLCLLESSKISVEHQSI